MPELSLAEGEKQPQSSESSPPSSVVFDEKTNISPNDSAAGSVGTGGDEEGSPMSSCSEEYATVTKPRQSIGETEDINTEFNDDKLE